MNRLRRKGIKASADWWDAVSRAFVDLAAFWREAVAFEALDEHGPQRKKGFARHAPHVLPAGKKGKPEFPAVWRDHDDLRQKIAGMSFGLCAYCQVYVSSSHAGKGGKEKPPGQVEHFRPKSRFPMLAYAWENYFLSCAGCNNAKSDKWPVGGFVRPDEGRPGKRFVFKEDGDVAARKGDVTAKRTIKHLELRRHWLAEHRRIAIEAHLRVVSKLMGRPGIALADLLLTPPAAFSEAVNQCVRRAWRKRGRGGP